MSILNRISNYFNFMDSAYSDMYEKQVAFEENPTDSNKKILIKSIDQFQLQYRRYKQLLKDTYIPPEIDNKYF